ncbi:hypothetical protein ABGB18_39770 [Nonomuraea sp. B12E4]|uniref:hypothetical protein n=1 Tax=Nonomuraea sp. B12E4 TaxID=3153564 RepID=UPI00325C5B31
MPDRAEVIERLLDDRACHQDWDAVVGRAVLEEEEHNPELAYVLRRVWERSGHRSINRVAASQFTTTPELPHSFEEPPIA